MRISNRRTKQRGLSIVELMVAVTISMIMFAVIIELFANNKEAYRLQGGASELNENARFAISHLQFYMRLADHWGGVEQADVELHDPASLVVTDPGECTGSPIISAQGFRGFNGTNATPPIDCIPAANYEPETDAFFLRYGAGHEDGRTAAEITEKNGAPELPRVGQDPVQNSYFADTDSAGIWMSLIVARAAFIFERSKRGTLPADFQHTDPAQLRTGEHAWWRYYSMLYYIRPCSDTTRFGNASICDGNDPPIPTLVRRKLGLDMKFVEEEAIVTGVENMQLLYGVDTNGDLIADRYDTAATVQAAANWDAVVAVRVSLMVANQERDNTVNDSATYHLLDADWVPPAEAASFRRTQFDFTVQIRNASRV